MYSERMCAEIAAPIAKNLSFGKLSILTKRKLGFVGLSQKPSLGIRSLLMYPMSLGNKVGRKSKFSFRNNYNPLWAKPKSLLLRDADHGGSKYLDYGWSSKKLIQYCSRIQLKRKVQCMYILYQRSCQIKKNLVCRLSVIQTLYGQDDLDRKSTTDQRLPQHEW